MVKETLNNSTCMRVNNPETLKVSVYERLESNNQPLLMLNTCSGCLQRILFKNIV